MMKERFRHFYNKLNPEDQDSILPVVYLMTSDAWNLREQVEDKVHGALSFQVHIDEVRQDIYIRGQLSCFYEYKAEIEKLKQHYVYLVYDKKRHCGAWFCLCLTARAEYLVLKQLYPKVKRIYPKLP